MASITNIVRIQVTPTNQARSSASLANIARSGGTFSSAGLYYGFGAFTYAGVAQLVAGSSVSIINQLKS